MDGSGGVVFAMDDDGDMVLLVPPATDQVLAGRDLKIRRPECGQWGWRTDNDSRLWGLRHGLASREEASLLHARHQETLLMH